MQTWALLLFCSIGIYTLVKVSVALYGRRRNRWMDRYFE